jgi:hypothetical protein
MSAPIGAAGGSVTTASGITLRVPAGALSEPTALRIVETPPRDGAMARVELEPRRGREARRQRVVVCNQVVRVRAGAGARAHRRREREREQQEQKR